MRSQLAKMLKPRHERKGINKYFIVIKRNRCKKLNQRSSIYQPKIQEILTISGKYQKIIFFLRWYYVHKPTLTPPYPPYVLRLSRGSPTRLHLLPADATQRLPELLCSVPARCTRVFRSGGSPGIGIPASTKTFGSLTQLASFQ